MLSARVLGSRAARSRASPLASHGATPCSKLSAWSPSLQQGSKRWSTTVLETGTNKSGHISCGPNEGIFFIDSRSRFVYLGCPMFTMSLDLYPLKFRWLLRLPFLNIEQKVNETLSRSAAHFSSEHGNDMDPIGIVRKAIPKDLPITVTQIIPRIKEGGAFVKFSHDGTIDTSEIEGTLTKYLKENPIKPMFSPWRRVRAALVRGQPWIEDLYRFPSPKIKVEFLPTAPGGDAAELSQERIFSLLRRYGKIADIAPQPADSKILPKFATITFRLPRYSIMARNCMHGIVIGEEAGGGKAGTLLSMSYEQIIKAHYFRDWATNHPRIIIPLLAALAAAITVAVFDP